MIIRLLLLKRPALQLYMIRLYKIVRMQSQVNVLQVSRNVVQQNPSMFALFALQSAVLCTPGIYR